MGAFKSLFSTRYSVCIFLNKKNRISYRKLVSLPSSAYFPPAVSLPSAAV